MPPRIRSPTLDPSDLGSESEPSPSSTRLPKQLLDQVRAVLVNVDRELVSRKWDQLNAGGGQSRATESELIARTIRSLVDDQIEHARAHVPVAGPSNAGPAPRHLKRAAPDAIDLTLDSTDNESEGDVPLARTSAAVNRKGKAKAVSFVDLTDDDGAPSTSTTPPSSAEASPSTAKSYTREEAGEFILGVMPDIELALLERVLNRDKRFVFARTFAPQDVERIIGDLLESGYEKEGQAEKRKLEEHEREARFDWLDLDSRRSHQLDVAYHDAALEQLKADFGHYTSASLRNIFKEHKLYAPAYFAICKLAEANDAKLDKLKIHRDQRPPSKRVKFADDAPPPYRPSPDQPPELQREIAWVKRRIATEAADRLQAEAAKEEEAEAEAVLAALDADAVESGTAVECGCCYGEASAQTVANCAEGHSFCRECVRNFVDDRVGNRQFALECMSTEGCDSHLLRSQVQQLVKPRALALLDAIQQQRELQLAALEGWEVCPFCVEYGCCIENPDERLFRCEKEDCNKVSCRLCKREAHLGISCKEAENESKLPSLHAVEDAMTAALVRKCPKCKSPYVKADGCNLITCSTCHAQSCYLCLKVVPGHNHFVDNRAVGASTGCALFDDTQTRNFNEVEAARIKAAAQSVAEGVDQTQLEALALDKPHPDGRYQALARVPGAIGVGRGRGVDPAGVAAFENGRADDAAMFYRQLRAQAEQQMAGGRVRAGEAHPDLVARHARMQERLQPLGGALAGRIPPGMFLPGPMAARGPDQARPQAAQVARRMVEAPRRVAERPNRRAQLPPPLAQPQPPRLPPPAPVPVRAPAPAPGERRGRQARGPVLIVE